MIPVSSNQTRYAAHRTLGVVHSAPETGSAGLIRGVPHPKGFCIPVLRSGRGNESSACNRRTASQTSARQAAISGLVACMGPRGEARAGKPQTTRQRLIEGEQGRARAVAKRSNRQSPMFSPAKTAQHNTRQGSANPCFGRPILERVS